MKKEGATAVINHHIIEGQHEQYEDWLNEIGPLCRSYPGHINWQIIRPIPDMTYSYTVILQFDTIENLKNWMDSPDRKVLIEKVRPLLAKDDSYYIKSGLEFLFSVEGKSAKVPVRWKQFLVTWSAIFPLSMLIPWLILPIVRGVNIPPIQVFDSLVITGVVVFLMIYLVMPHYSRLIKGWLYK